MNKTNEQVLPFTPYGGMLEPVKEFDARHRRNSIVVGVYKTYEDGARRDADMAAGPMIEPPDNDFERLSIRLKYWETLVAEAVETFEKTKRDFLAAAKNSSNWGHPPPDKAEAMQRLDELKSLIDGRRERLEAVREELEATKGFQRRKRAAKQTAENRNNAQEIINTVQSFQV